MCLFWCYSVLLFPVLLIFFSLGSFGCFDILFWQSSKLFKNLYFYYQLHEKQLKKSRSNWYKYFFFWLKHFQVVWPFAYFRPCIVNKTPNKNLNRAAMNRITLSWWKETYLHVNGRIQNWEGKYILCQRDKNPTHASFTICSILFEAALFWLALT